MICIIIAYASTIAIKIFWDFFYCLFLRLLVHHFVMMLFKMIDELILVFVVILELVLDVLMRVVSVEEPLFLTVSKIINKICLHGFVAFGDLSGCTYVIWTQSLTNQRKKNRVVPKMSIWGSILECRPYLNETFRGSQTPPKTHFTV